MARLKGWMRRKMYDLLFGDEAGPSAHVHASALLSAAATPTSGVVEQAAADAPDDGLDDLEGRLARFFKSVEEGHRKVSAGKLQIVDLAGLREQLGGFGDRGGELVHQLAGGVIRSHLGPADVMSRHRDDSYVVLFAQLNEEEAQLKAKLIADQIAERLLGASKGKHAIRIKSVVAHVDGSVDLVDVDGEALLERLMTEADEQFARLSDGTDATAFHESSASLEKLYKASFTPMWYVPRQVVSAQVCQIERCDGAADPGHMDGADIHEAVDHLALRHCVTRLTDTLADNKVEVAILPVHYATLINDVARSRYLEAMSKVSEDCRQLICHEVVDIPHELAPARFNSIMSTLRRYSRSITCRVPLDFRGFRLIDPPAVHGLGIHLHYYSGKETRLMERMRVFARDVDARGLKPYVLGLRTRSQIIGALAAGFVYIHGAPIKAETGGLSKFEMADLYAC